MQKVTFDDQTRRPSQIFESEPWSFRCSLSPERYHVYCLSYL